MHVVNYYSSARLKQSALSLLMNSADKLSDTECKIISLINWFDKTNNNIQAI